MGRYLPEFTSEIAKIFAKSISNAVGDGISEDVLSKGLVTQNGSPARIWDILHANLVKTFSTEQIVAKPSKRGGWEILPMFDKRTGVVFCCMREKNFASISRRDPKKQRRHYLNALIKSFNRDLPLLQTKLDLGLVTDEIENQIVDVTISRIACDLGIPRNVITRHALVLFQSYDNQLVSLRCCAVNSQFEIIDSIDWSDYIPATTSVIVEAVDDQTNIKNTPTQGLRLKKKAEERLEKKPNVSLPQVEEEKNM